jgi:hypothetical protein
VPTEGLLEFRFGSKRGKPSEDDLLDQALVQKLKQVLSKASKGIMLNQQMEMIDQVIVIETLNPKP